MQTYARDKQITYWFLSDPIYRLFCPPTCTCCDRKYLCIVCLLSKCLIFEWMLKRLLQLELPESERFSISIRIGGRNLLLAIRYEHETLSFSLHFLPSLLNKFMLSLCTFFLSFNFLTIFSHFFSRKHSVFNNFVLYTVVKCKIGFFYSD